MKALGTTLMDNDLPSAKYIFSYALITYRNCRIADSGMNTLEVLQVSHPSQPPQQASNWFVLTVAKLVTRLVKASASFQSTNRELMQISSNSRRRRIINLILPIASGNHPFPLSKGRESLLATPLLSMPQEISGYEIILLHPDWL